MFDKIKLQIKKIFPKRAQEEKGRKKLQPIVPLGVILILAAVLTFLMLAIPEKNEKPDESVSGEPQTQELVPRKLDGRLVSAYDSNLLPISVMVENHWESRPPSGISQAGIVFEALTEAGITRFLALFDPGDEIAEIGPVRSARDYYIDWASEFGAIYAHVGGSPQSLEKIPQANIYDLNQFYNGRFFWRSDEREAPHNVYTNSELMNKVIYEKEIENQGAYGAWRFKDDMPQTNPRATEINLNFSVPEYEVRWVYTSDTNEYIRFQEEEEHEDKDGTLITTKNIAVAVTEATVIDREGRLKLRTLGKGRGWVFRDGGVMEAIWQKNDSEDRLRFYDVTGREIEFNRGTTWVEIITRSWGVTFK